MDTDNKDRDDSIFRSVRHFLTISGCDDDPFDPAIKSHINMALNTLYQIGGIEKPYTLETCKDKWSKIITDENREVESFIKQYVEVKVQLMFDPPSSSILLELLKESLNEYEYRISVGKYFLPDAEENEEEGSDQNAETE